MRSCELLAEFAISLAFKAPCDGGTTSPETRSAVRALAEQAVAMAAAGNRSEGSWLENPWGAGSDWLLGRLYSVMFKHMCVGIDCP